MPKDKEKPKADKPADAKPAKPPNPEEEKQAMAMMKGMMAGLKLATVVEVNGKIVSDHRALPARRLDGHADGADFDQMGEDGLNKLSKLTDQPGLPTPEQLEGPQGRGKVHRGRDRDRVPGEVAPTPCRPVERVEHERAGRRLARGAAGGSPSSTYAPLP